MGTFLLHSEKGFSLNNLPYKAVRFYFFHYHSVYNKHKLNYNFNLT